MGSAQGYIGPGRLVQKIVQSTTGWVLSAFVSSKRWLHVLDLRLRWIRMPCRACGVVPAAVPLWRTFGENGLAPGATFAATRNPRCEAHPSRKRPARRRAAQKDGSGRRVKRSRPWEEIQGLQRILYCQGGPWLYQVVLQVRGLNQDGEAPVKRGLRTCTDGRR
jgi:hypothetical protein